MDVAQHRLSVRTGLVEQKLYPVGQQRRGDRHQHGMVAGAPQRFVAAMRERGFITSLAVCRSRPMICKIISFSDRV